MVRSQTIFASIMVETICLGFLWVLILGEPIASPTQDWYERERS